MLAVLGYRGKEGENAMKNILKALIVCIISCTCLLGCNNNKLSEIYDENTIVEKAKEVIFLANEFDYDTIAEMAVLPDGMTKEDLAKTVEEGWDATLKKNGTFVEFKQHQVAGQQDKKTDVDYAVIAIQAVYENGTSVFTFYFDQDYALVGLYMK